MLNKDNFIPNNIKDKIDQDLLAYMPRYYQNRTKDLRLLRKSVESRKKEDILSMTHKILGTAKTYGLNELDYVIGKLESFTKESKMEEVEYCLDWAERYIAKRLADI